MSLNRLYKSIVLSVLLVPGVLCVSTAAAQSAIPVINANGVVEGASFSPRVVAGGIATIFGTNLAPSAFTANDIPLPTIMNTVTVTLNGDQCPLLYVSPNQINFQVRWEVQTLNSSNLIVTTKAGSSSTYFMTLSPAAPGVFPIGKTAQGAALISNTNIFAATAGSIPGATSRPAVAGEYVSIYCSGLGDVTNKPASGGASPAGKNVAAIKGLLQVGIGSTFAMVSFAGMAPGFVGLYQVDILIPQGVSGAAVPVVLMIGGVNATQATISVQ